MRTLNAPPGTEVLGTNIRAFYDNLLATNTTPVMRKYGLHDIDPTRWYPLNDLLAALNEIGTLPDAAQAFVAIGIEVGRIVPLPPELSTPTLGQVLATWNAIYQALHRGGDLGAIVFEQVDDRHLKTIHTDLYPDDFTYGIVYGYARRFLPADAAFRVYFDPDQPRRDDGGDLTIIHVRWT